MRKLTESEMRNIEGGKIYNAYKKSNGKYHIECWKKNGSWHMTSDNIGWCEYMGFYAIHKNH